MTCRMEGPPLPPSATSLDPAVQGMIPRTVQQIFSSAEALKEKGWSYTMEGTFLEIYNEVVRDLLEERDEKAGKAEWGAGAGKVGEGKKYEIRHLPGGRTVVEGAVVGECLGCPSVLSWRRKCNAYHDRRLIANTNPHSNRDNTQRSPPPPPPRHPKPRRSVHTLQRPIQSLPFHLLPSPFRHKFTYGRNFLRCTEFN